jgi:hypothetical protein
VLALRIARAVIVLVVDLERGMVGNSRTANDLHIRQHWCTRRLFHIKAGWPFSQQNCLFPASVCFG